MKIILKTILFIVGVLFFTGGACPSNDTTASNKVAQSEIYQSYSIKQSGQSYEVTAFFRIGGPTGTTLALSAPSKVAFNGAAMQEHLNTTSGTFYTATVPANTPGGSFVFTDQKGMAYNNKIDLARVEISASNQRTDGKTPVSIPLSSRMPQSATLNLELNNSTVFLGANEAGNADGYYDNAKNTIVVLPSAWKNISKGNVSFDLVVKNTVATQQGTALGGEIVFTSISAPVNVAYVNGRSTGNTPLAKTTTANTNNAAASNVSVKKAVNTPVSVNKDGAK